MHYFTALIYNIQLNFTLPKTSVPEPCFTSLLKTPRDKGLPALLLTHAILGTVSKKMGMNHYFILFSLLCSRCREGIFLPQNLRFGKAVFTSGITTDFSIFSKLSLKVKQL